MKVCLIVCLGLLNVPVLRNNSYYGEFVKNSHYIKKIVNLSCVVTIPGQKTSKFSSKGAKCERRGPQNEGGKEGSFFLFSQKSVLHNIEEVVVCSKGAIAVAKTFIRSSKNIAASCVFQ